LCVYLVSYHVLFYAQAACLDSVQINDILMIMMFCSFSSSVPSPPAHKVTDIHRRDAAFTPRCRAPRFHSEIITRFIFDRRSCRTVLSWPSIGHVMFICFTVIHFQDSVITTPLCKVCLALGGVLLLHFDSNVEVQYISIVHSDSDVNDRLLKAA